MSVLTQAAQLLLTVGDLYVTYDMLSEKFQSRDELKSDYVALKAIDEKAEPTQADQDFLDQMELKYRSGRDQAITDYINS